MYGAALMAPITEEFFSHVPEYMSVSTGPGFTALTVTLHCRPNYLAHTSVRPSTAALVEAETVCVAKPAAARRWRRDSPCDPPSLQDSGTGERLAS